MTKLRIRDADVINQIISDYIDAKDTLKAFKKRMWEIKTILKLEKTCSYEKLYEALYEYAEHERQVKFRLQCRADNLRRKAERKAIEMQKQKNKEWEDRIKREIKETQKKVDKGELPEGIYWINP